jgi:hypothetical protein
MSLTGRSRFRNVVLEPDKPPAIVLQVEEYIGDDINFRAICLWRDATLEDITTAGRNLQQVVTDR